MGNLKGNVFGKPFQFLYSGGWFLVPSFSIRHFFIYQTFNPITRISHSDGSSINTYLLISRISESHLILTLV